MKSTLVQLTLRRWGEIVTSPKFYCLFLAFVAFSTVFGPHGLLNEYSFLERLLVALEINVVCWIIGVGAAVPLRIGLESLGVSRPISLVVACVSASMIILSFLYYQLGAILGVSVAPSVFIEYGVMLIMIVVFVAAIMQMRSDGWDGNPVSSSGPTPGDDTNSLLQSKLPADKRGILYAMIAQDHYVEFITNKGSELVLMRLSDAVEMTTPGSGLQVHRSAWVSTQGMHSLHKRGRNKVVVLPNGRDVSVARSMQNEVVEFARRLSDEYPAHSDALANTRI